MPAANAVTQTKYYDATVYWLNQQSVNNVEQLMVGIPVTVVAVISNDTTGSTASTQPFGSAQLDFGSAVAVQTAQVCAVTDTSSLVAIPPESAQQVAQDQCAGASPTTSGWNTPTVSGGRATFTSQNGTAVSPGQSLVVQLQVLPTAAVTATVGTTVKQANNFAGSGNNFILVNAAALQFQAQNPSLQFVAKTVPATVGQSLPKASPSAVWVDFCPQVQLTPAIAGVSISLNYTGPSNPGLYYQATAVGSSGVAVTTGSNGVAAFGTCTSASGLEATNIGPSYSLTATLTVASSVQTTSSSFQVVTTCVGTCTLQSGSTKTSATVQSTGNEIFQAYFGFSSQTAGTATDPLACSTAVTLPGDAISPIATESSSGPTGDGTITLNFTKQVMNSLPNNGTPQMPVCAGADKSFPSYDSTEFPAATYPLGPPAPYAYRYMGLLYDCTDATYLGAVAASGTGDLLMCVQSRSRLPGGGEQVVIYTNDLSDPMYW